MKWILLLVATANFCVAVAQPPIIKTIPQEKLAYKDPITINWNFESNLSAWTKTGNAFDNQPVAGHTVTTARVKPDMNYYANGIGGDYWQDIPYPIGFKDNQWIGTYEWNNFDAPQGTLTSKEFVLDKRYIHFLMGGGMGANIYVALEVKKEDYTKIMAFDAPPNIVTADGFAPIRKITNSENSEVMKRQVFDLRSIALNTTFKNHSTNIKDQNITARIVIADLSSGGWGHINVDDFQFVDVLPDFIVIGQNRYDKDMPVWGYADTHAHWVNHVGSRGFMHGSTGGNWRNSNVKQDIPPCDESAHNAPKLTPALIIGMVENAALKRAGERIGGDAGNLVCGTLTALSNLPFILNYGVAMGSGFAARGMNGLIDGILNQAVSNPVNHACAYPLLKDAFKHYGNNTPNDPKYPEAKWFIDFPRWNTLFHQQMHISWVRRSYEGGQRLMVVPASPAKSWEFNMTADGNTTPVKKIIEDQIIFLKQLVAMNNDWLDIAYTPKQAREIILNNKMAIVIGVEQAEIGDFGFASAEEEINWLHSLGVRHYFPIHNIDNKLGGAAVFNSTLNAYNDLVNRKRLGLSLVEFKVREGNDGTKDFTEFKFSESFMQQKMKNIPLLGFGDMPFFEFRNLPTYNQHHAHKNLVGLTEFGNNYIKKLMQKGVVIDLDHMSDLAQQETTDLFLANNYSLLSGHTNFRDLRRLKSETSKEEGNIRTEFTISDSKATLIGSKAGYFGIMSQQDDIRDADGCPIPNNAPGSSSSFAQAYWYAYQKTGGFIGIGFGSDFNGFAPQTAPRFGVDAAAMIEGDEKRNRKLGNRNEENQRRAYAFAQLKGVKYDKPISTYHYHRFQLPSFLTQEERDIWEALAIAKSGVDPEQAWQPGGGISVQRTFIQQQKIKNLAHGFRNAATNLNWLTCPDYILKGDCPAERKAAFMAVSPQGEYALSADMKEDARVMQLYNIIKPIVTLWNQFENGPNQPLRRSYAYNGGRDFDFNLDGLAHYGMFPDLIQDLKNNGFTTQHLNPLFMGPEQYIKLWEQAETASKNIR
jgi:microsomal dipeptidase-like Zn-dependent dipeptidase